MIQIKQLKWGLLALLMMGEVLCAQSSATDADKLINGLMQQMTLDEKIGQLNLMSATDSALPAAVQAGGVGGLCGMTQLDEIRAMQQMAVRQSRLGIPLLFGVDATHGYQTVFPIPLALSCTWDLNSIEQAMQVFAAEASADGVNWLFAPMLNVLPTPYQSNVGNGLGENPYLAGMIAQRMVWGLQGKQNPLSSVNQVMACAKYLAQSNVDTDSLSQQTLFNDYLPPFLAAVQAGVSSAMSVSPDKWLLTDIFRNRWGFQGLMVWSGEADAREMMNAGADAAINKTDFIASVRQAIESGALSVQQIDSACRRVLAAKYELGLFADPFKYCNKNRPQRDINTSGNQKSAQRIAAESFVLLKNDVPTNPQDEVKYTNPLLPLPPQATVAVIGPMGNTQAEMLGGWCSAATPSNTASLMEGLEVLSEQMNNMMLDQVNEPWYIPLATHGTDIKLLYAQGCSFEGEVDDGMLDEALQIATKADYIVAALGEPAAMGGQTVTSLGLPAVQQDLLKALVATGKPVVLVLFTTRPMALDWEAANVPAILNVWFGGSEAAYAIGSVLFGRYVPNGKLTMSFPSALSETPLYPFGYGLSYTHFSYSNMQINATTMSPTDELCVSMMVTNMGTYPGTEVVQFYIQNTDGSNPTYGKRLQGWQKIRLDPGASDVVTFTISLENLKCYDEALNYVARTGVYQAQIGKNSRDVQSVTFTAVR